MLKTDAVSGWIEYGIEPSSKLCFVHFSARNTPLGKFNRWPTPAGSSNIYINSAARDWYVHGLPCWGSTLDDSFHEFSKLLKKLNGQKIVCVGSSMGAYGAALFARKFGLDLVCFGPELHLNIYSGFSRSDKPLDGQRIDALGSRPARCLMFAGMNSPSDVVCAAYFSRIWPSSESIYLPGCGHATGKFLKDRSLLTEVLDRFSRGLDVSDAVRSMSYNGGDVSDFSLPPPHLFSEASLDLYLEAAYRNFKTSDVLEICGHLRSRGAFGPALRVLDKVFTQHGPIAEVMMLRAQCLRRLRRDDEALSVFSALRNNQFYGAGAAMGVAMIANRGGQFAAERDVYAALVTGAKKSLAQYSALFDKTSIAVSNKQTLSDAMASIDSEVQQKLESVASEPVGNSLSAGHFSTRVDELIGTGQLDAARTIAEAGLSSFPDDTVLCKKLVLVAQAQRDWVVALQQLEALLAFEGSQPSSWTYASLVQACRNSRQFERADSYAVEGLNRYPDNPDILSEYAWNAQSLKNWTLALSRLEQLKATSGGMGRDKTYQRLAQVYRGCGRLGDARRIIDEGLARFPMSQRLIKERDALTEMQASVSANEMQSEKSKHATPRCVLLTTFPGHKSMNVGDNLISSSAIKLIKARDPSFDPIVLFREEGLDHFPDGSISTIIAPGFSVSDGVYPSLFTLYTDLKRMPYFAPVGCSFQHPVPALSSFVDYRYGRETIDFLQFISKSSGPLPCRDQLIVDLLLRHEIPAVYSGDLAIFDEVIVGTPFVPPRQINSVVFTIQHHERYFEQSCILLNLLKSYFPNTRLYVAFHSKVGSGAKRVADHAESLGFNVLHLYGDVANLSVYDEIDLHVGYRLHGHISFLRRRKPSVLLVEDARSFGFAYTQGTSLGCFEAMLPDLSIPDVETPRRVMDFLTEQISGGFQDYRSVFEFIDKTFFGFVSPFFDRLSKKISE